MNLERKCSMITIFDILQTMQIQEIVFLMLILQVEFVIFYGIEITEEDVPFVL